MRALEPWIRAYLDERVSEGAEEIVLSQEDFEKVMMSFHHRVEAPVDPETLLIGPMALTWKAVPMRWSRAEKPLARE